MIVDIYKLDGSHDIYHYVRTFRLREEALYLDCYAYREHYRETIPRKDIVCFTVHLRNKVGRL